VWLPPPPPSTSNIEPLDKDGRRWITNDNAPSNGQKQHKMTIVIPSPWLRILIAAAVLTSTANAFAHHPVRPSSVTCQRHSSMYKPTQLQLSTVENNEFPLDVVSASDITPPSSEKARDLLALESSEVGEEGVMPFAPMMTFQKYLTMQVCAF
jgi:hypothetical protein